MSLDSSKQGPSTRKHVRRKANRLPYFLRSVEFALENNNLSRPCWTTISLTHWHGQYSGHSNTATGDSAPKATKPHPGMGMADRAIGSHPT
jgi:hypothetical protein